MNNKAIAFIQEDFALSRAYAHCEEVDAEVKLHSPDCLSIPDHIRGMRSSYCVRVVEGVLLSVFREPHTAKGESVELSDVELVQLAGSRLFKEGAVNDQYVLGYAQTMKEKGKFANRVLPDIKECCDMAAREYDRVVQHLLHPKPKKFRNTARENLQSYREFLKKIDGKPNLD